MSNEGGWMKGGWFVNIAVLILFFFLGLMVYKTSLNSPFRYDDETVVVKNFNIKEIKNIPLFFVYPKMSSVNPMKAGHYRPLVVTSYAINYAIGGLNTSGYHVVNLIFHAGSAFLIFLILKAMLVSIEHRAEGRRLKTEVRSKKQEENTLPFKGRDRVGMGFSEDLAGFFAALAAGLIFLVHPFNSEAVNYITARSSLMSGFFYLLAFWCWVRYRSKQLPVIAREAKQSEKGIASGILFPRNDNRKVFYIASILAFIAGMLSKEVLITLPIMLWLYDLYFKNIPQSTPTLTLPRQGGGKKGGGIFSWRNYIPYIPFVLMVIIPYLLMRFFSLGKVLDRFKRGPVTQTLTEIPVLVKHWQMFFFPRGLSMIHDVAINRNITLSVLFSFILLAGYIVLAIILSGHKDRYWRAASFFMFWFFIVLLPTTIMPLNAIFQENRGYLAIVSFTVVAALVLMELGIRMGRTTAIIILLVIVIIYSVVTVQRNLVWGDEIMFWKDVMNKAPHSSTPYSILSEAYRERGDLFLALETAKKGISVDPDDFYIRINLGRSYQLLGDVDHAISAYEDALRIDPVDAITMNELAVLYSKKGDLDRTEKYLKAASRIWKSLPHIHYNLAVVLAGRGKLSDAEEEFQKAIAIYPEYLQARYEMGEVLDKLGRNNEANRQYEEVIRLESDPKIFLYEQDKIKMEKIINQARQALVHAGKK